MTVTNTGLSNANSVTVADTLPSGVTLTATVTCVAAGTSSCGTVTGSAGGTSFGATGAMIVPGAGNALTFTVPVAFAASLATTPLVNTATATDGVGGATGSGSDSDSRAPQVTLAVTKTDDSTTYVPGGTAIYVVTVRNTGVSDALDITVNDALPVGVTLTGTVACARKRDRYLRHGDRRGGTSDVRHDRRRSRHRRGRHARVHRARVLRARAHGRPAREHGDRHGHCIGRDCQRLGQRHPQLAVGDRDHQDRRQQHLHAGGIGTYTVVITNTGVSAALNVTVSDPLPADVTLRGNATCVATGAASCGTVTGATGQASFGLTGGTIGAGAGNALTLMAPVAFAAGMTANPLVNTATASEAARPPVSASDSDTLSQQVSLTVTKTDGSTTYTPGGTAAYTIVVTNTGVSDAVNVTVSDSLPSGVTLNASVTCTPVGNASCGTVTGSAGQASFSATGAHVGTGGGNSLTFTVPVTFGLNLTANPLTNQVNVTDVASGATASASDSDSLNQTATTLGKTIAPASIAPGGAATLTITLGNPSAAPIDAHRAVRRHDAGWRDHDERQQRDLRRRYGDGYADHDGGRAHPFRRAAARSWSRSRRRPGHGDQHDRLAVDKRRHGAARAGTADRHLGGGGPVPPTLAKSIAPSTIEPGGTATLTLTLGNPGSAPLTLTAAFVDRCPPA